MRNPRCDNIDPTPALRAKSMGRSPIAQTGQHVLGALKHKFSFARSAPPRAASRRRRLAAPAGRRSWQAGSRAAAARSAPSVAPPPRRQRVRLSHRTGMAGTSLVPGSASLRSRDAPRVRSHAALADGHDRLRAAASAAARAWQRTGLSLAESVLGSGPGVATAAGLLGQALAPTTSASYQRLWVLFEHFCLSAGRCPLPASPATVCAYLGTLFDGGRLRGTSIRPYVAAVGAQHRRLALDDPTAHNLVVMARRGFAAADARRRTGAPLRSAAYPAHAALHCLHAALRAAHGATLRYWAAVAVGFLISARPASIAGLTPDAVRLTPDAVLVELRVFKYGTSGYAPRVSIRIPTAGTSDPICRLFHLLLADTTTRPDSSWFCIRDLSAAAAAGLRAVAAFAPPGSHYTPRSLRSGGITAAYAVGVPLERIMRVSNHASTAVVLRHYLDPLVPPTPAARVFFDRFVHAARALPGPVSPVAF
jgi:hypothetical protein